MQKNSFWLRLPENAVFWLFLIFMAAGSAASLHRKLTEQAASNPVREISPVYSVSIHSGNETAETTPADPDKEAAVFASTDRILALPAASKTYGLSLSSLLIPALPYPCEIGPLP